MNISELIQKLTDHRAENGEIVVLALSEDGLIYEIDDTEWDSDTAELYLHITEADEQDDEDDEDSPKADTAKGESVDG